MTRLGAAALAVALLACGCGGPQRPREVRARLTPPRGCVVKVFFATSLMSGREATQREVRSVRARIQSSTRIRSFAFVSKRLALRRMQRLHPGLFGGLPGNPLPPSFELVPRSTGDAAVLARELRDARGVEHVSASQAC